jgi:hypothetical protein
VRKPENSTPATPATLVKPQAQARPHLAIVRDDRTSRVLSENNLGRRRVPRRSFDCPIGLLAKGEYQTERSFQVGEGGMMFSSSRKLEIGQEVVISFYLPTSATIVVRASVRSLIPAGKGRPERYGVEFTNLGFQFKREIRNFVASATSLDAA